MSAFASIGGWELLLIAAVLGVLVSIVIAVVAIVVFVAKQSSKPKQSEVGSDREAKG